MVHITTCNTPSPPPFVSIHPQLLLWSQHNIQQCTPTHVQCNTYRVWSPLNPVHAFEGITEIWLPSKFLQQQKSTNNINALHFTYHGYMRNHWISILIYHVYPSNYIYYVQQRTYSWIYLHLCTTTLTHHPTQHQQCPHQSQTLQEISIPNSPCECMVCNLRFLMKLLTNKLCW